MTGGPADWRAGGRVARLLGSMAAGILVVPASPPVRLPAQVHAEAGRLFEAEGWTTYRLGIERGLIGPVSVALYGTHLRDESPLGRRHWGGGADLVVLRGRRSGPYLAGGLSGGFSSDSLDDWWNSWSAGGGYQLGLGRAIALAGEARWRSVNPGRRDGVELSLRLGAVFGGGSRSAPAEIAEPASAPPEPALDPPAPRPPPLATVAPAAGSTAAAPLALADSVVATALAALGTNYRLGGTTSDGFDCSGLIQHAYGRHGITLPRVSRDQAKEGTAVKRKLEALRPGDILTFAQRRGGRITHVGLYLGEGRFVHSASGGVQVSMLSDDDPYGRWYWKRWVGARRIVARDT